MSKKKNILSILLFSLWSILGCEANVANVVGVSSSSLIIGLKAMYGNFGLTADASSQATIRVELFTNAGLLVNGEVVTLTTTLGTLGAATVTTTNGVAITTLTSEAFEGTAYVVASVENVSATVAVPFVNITSEAD
jgi:hypothetical protein|tara:strand:+ start:657 stop:1064 length:408 start_codon:yes stop_codon:yes gene_type:complete